MPRKDSLDIISKAMFDDSIKLVGPDLQLKERLKDVYTHWLSHPTHSDSHMVKYMQVNFNMSRAQAYNDIGRVKMLLGNIPIASRTWFQNKVNVLLDEAANAARTGDYNKAKALNKIAESFIANNRLDSEEGNDIPYDEIVIGDLSFSIDPAVVGVKKIPGVEEKARKLLKKYTEDVDYDEGSIPK